MPYIEIRTNVPIDRDRSEVLRNLLGREIELLPGKSEQWLMTSLRGGEYMALGGRCEPCVMVQVSLFGSADASAYDRMTASLCEKLRLALNVPENRIYIKYEEVSHWGWNGSTF